MTLNRQQFETERLVFETMPATERDRDRRGYIRRYFPAALSLTANDGTQHPGQSQNMSLSGMLIATAMPGDIHQNVDVVLHGTFSVSGTIVRMTETGFAVSYEINEHERLNLATAIQDYIDKNLLIPRVKDRRSGNRGRRALD